MAAGDAAWKPPPVRTSIEERACNNQWWVGATDATGYAIECPTAIRAVGAGTWEEVVSEYVVIIEGERGSYGAYVPDLPGCVSVGKTIDEVRSLIREAIAFHLEGMRLAGESIPPPASVLVDFVQAV